jgi:hypothetical protein
MSMESRIRNFMWKISLLDWVQQYKNLQGDINAINCTYNQVRQREFTWGSSQNPKERNFITYHYYLSSFFLHAYHLFFPPFFFSFCLNQFHFQSNCFESYKEKKMKKFNLCIYCRGHCVHCSFIHSLIKKKNCKRMKVLQLSRSLKIIILD